MVLIVARSKCFCTAILPGARVLNKQINGCMNSNEIAADFTLLITRNQSAYISLILMKCQCFVFMCL